MTNKELIKKLRTESLYKDKAVLEVMDLCMEAATAITDLLIENQALRNAANDFKTRAESIVGGERKRRAAYAFLKSNNIFLKSDNTKAPSRVLFVLDCGYPVEIVE